MVYTISMLEEKESFEFCQDEEKLVEVIGRDFFNKIQAKKQTMTINVK